MRIGVETIGECNKSLDGLRIQCNIHPPAPTQLEGAANGRHAHCKDVTVPRERGGESL